MNSETPNAFERPEWLADVEGPGDYPWDHWEQRAKDAGVPDGLAALGRSLMREAYQHNWSEELQQVCGWDDNGEAMIQFALAQPEKAERDWNTLMQTDGDRDDSDR